MPHKLGASIRHPWPQQPVPEDWRGDERHYPEAPAHVDLVQVDERDGKVKVVLREIMPYEAAPYLDHLEATVVHSPSAVSVDDHFRYETVEPGKYKDGDLWR